MASPVLWPIAGTAALGLGRRIVNALGDGLSFAGELARQDGGGSQVSQAEPASTGPEASLARRIEALKKRITERLQQAGIRLAEPVSLISDGLAGLAVSGEHSQAAAIEEALAADLVLEREFDRLAKECRDVMGCDVRIEVPPAV